jgi:curved DNA-binding protein
VVFRPEAGFTVDGSDVYQTVALTPWEAALGATLDLATPGGTFQVTVPPDSQPGRRLRLKGKGLPAAVPGDLFLVLEVVLPRATSDVQRAAYLAMAREMPFNPRLAKEIPA